MAQKDRKIQEKRGSRSCGYGNAQKHRGAGSRGGRGNAGSTKHKQKQGFRDKKILGKVGFKSRKKTTNNVINLSMITSNIESWQMQGKTEKSGKSLVIDLTKLGYDKVLGAGIIKIPVVLKAQSFSKSAIEKIKKAGGDAIAEKTDESAESKNTGEE